MPAKNIVKQYLKNGYYHIYNRGVEKRNIFQDSQDYKVFLSYLKEYLEPLDKKAIRKELAKAHYSIKDRLVKKLLMNNFADKIDLFAFCLMPNHFHLLIKQKTERGIKEFIQSLATRYVIYFNKRNNRVGGLFQGSYKAVLVETDGQLLHLSRYIHQNPASHGPYKGRTFLKTFLKYPFSSLGAYLGEWKVKWIKPQSVLSFFSRSSSLHSYKNFVIQTPKGESKSLVRDFLLES